MMKYKEPYPWSTIPNTLKGHSRNVDMGNVYLK